MKTDGMEPGPDEFDNENEFADGHERRRRRWSDQERKLRKERRHPRENDLYGN